MTAKRNLQKYSWWTSTRFQIGSRAVKVATSALREVIMQKNGFSGGKGPVSYADVAPGMYVGGGKPLPF